MIKTVSPSCSHRHSVVAHSYYGGANFIVSPTPTVSYTEESVHRSASLARQDPRWYTRRGAARDLPRKRSVHESARWRRRLLPGSATWPSRSVLSPRARRPARCPPSPSSSLNGLFGSTAGRKAHRDFAHTRIPSTLATRPAKSDKSVLVTFGWTSRVTVAIGIQ